MSVLRLGERERETMRHVPLWIVVVLGKEGWGEGGWGLIDEL